MSKHTHKSAEARELAVERRVSEKERTLVRHAERNVKAAQRAVIGGAW